MLKKPNFSRCYCGILDALAIEVEINLENHSTRVNVEWNANFFCDGKIKFAARDVCA